MYGKTERNNIRNENIWDNVRVEPIIEKMVKSKLRWFGNVKRIHVDYVLRGVDQMKMG